MTSASPPWNDLYDSVCREFQSLTTHWANLKADVSPAAKHPKNYHKNRYNNILPFEETRVKLRKTENSDDDSEYINASFIDGLTPQDKKQYISCQAPMTSTIDDFWRMVWEQNSGVIVMLTRVVENEKVKADVYWPEEEGEIEVYGNISVCFSTMHISHDRSIITRRFLVRCENEDTEREIFQLHFCQWPDFGVPDNTQPILRLCEAMTQLRERTKKFNLCGPAIVHCSAGVGRTGTFIAIHLACSNWEKLILGGTGNIVLRTVHHLRLQRKGMVQTGQQYFFIYCAILEYLRQTLLKSIRNANEETINSYLFSLLQYFTCSIPKEYPVGGCSEPSPVLSAVAVYSQEP